MTFHWWRTDKLVHQLAAGAVSELETARYAMLAVVLYFQVIYYATWFGGYRGWLILYEFFVVTGIGIVAVNECFKANGGAQGSDFLKRFTVLSVPVGVKLAIASIVIGQSMYFGFPILVDGTIFRNPEYVYELVCFGFSVTFTVIYYWRISVHLARVAQRSRSNIAVNQDAPTAARLLP